MPLKYFTPTLDKEPKVLRAGSASHQARALRGTAAQSWAHSHDCATACEQAHAVCSHAHFACTQKGPS